MLSQRLRLEDVQWDSDGHTLVWLEGRSDRGVLVGRAEGDARRDLTSEQSVRGGVGYGGGEFTVAGGCIFYTDRGGQLFTRSLGQGQATVLTPPFGAAVSPALSPDGKWLTYIFSDGQTDLLGLVDSAGRAWPGKLSDGADFYMQPVWHPSGEMLAWVEWDHPNMPWDGTRIVLAKLDGEPPIVAERKIVAGDAITPVSQPRFSPDGRWLSYLAADGDWEDLVVMDVTSGEKRILVKGDGFALAQLAWVQGVRSYDWSHSGDRLYYLRYAQGGTTLWQGELGSGRSTLIEIAPYAWIQQLSVNPQKDELAFIASAPSIPDRVVRWDGHALHVEARCDSEMIESGFLPTPRLVTWLASDKTPVQGFYYPPTNVNFASNELPPVILNFHGGPTSEATLRYSAEAVYFTSRGYAFMEVNYRGSSGYGRTYRELLRQHWGDVDTEDASGAAHALIDQGLADAKRLVIKGGSAGGYTVLNALIRYPGLFKAGLCSYGVSNLFLLNLETHKFEAHYNDSMVGILPEAAARFHAWSPQFHLDAIRDALAVFQGKEDKVVLPDQADVIIQALQRNHVPYIFRLYEGEGHGFRKPETILDYYQQVDKFLIQYVLFGNA
jgi:dipeptidyl aminopeptidase/acylaminoacyl peptidase